MVFTPRKIVFGLAFVQNLCIYASDFRVKDFHEKQILFQDILNPKGKKATKILNHVYYDTFISKFFL